jgi:cob(I)alamin adenosyltransferase
MPIRINRVYTKTGDTGETCLASGERVKKYHPRVECYGTLDELNVYVGLLRTQLEAPSFQVAPQLVEVWMTSLQKSKIICSILVPIFHLPPSKNLPPPFQDHPPR